MQDRRALCRARTYLAATVIFNHRFSTMDCLVRNLSEDGAKLTFFGAAMIPSEVDVFIRKNGDSRRAKVIWRTEETAGIKFLQSGHGQVVSLETARKIRKLEAEVAMLAKRVAELLQSA